MLNGKIFIKTFGCQMNEYDSNRIYDSVSKLGFVKTTNQSNADCYVLNTCHIRDKAKEKVYHEIGRVKKLYRDKKKPIMVVAGCVAQAENEEMVKREPYIDIVLGPQSYHKVNDLLKNHIVSLKQEETEFDTISKFGYFDQIKNNNSKISAFLTIQEGCDKFCHFCVVPYTRGPEYSRPFDKIISEAEQLILASLGQDGGEGIRAAMNPYIEEVINRSIEQARENEALQQIALGDRANQLNAFGGSRADMISGVLSADTNKNILRDSAGLYADAFTDATGRIKDAASGIAGLSGQASGLSQLQQALEQQGIGFMFDVGTKEQAQDQAVLDAERMTETQDLYEPYKRLSFVSDIYAGAPSGSMTTVEGGGSGNEPSLFEKLFGTAVGVSSSAAGIQSLFG